MRCLQSSVFRFVSSKLKFTSGNIIIIIIYYYSVITWVLLSQEFWVGNEELVNLYEKRLGDAGYVSFKLGRTNNRGDGTIISYALCPSIPMKSLWIYCYRFSRNFVFFFISNYMLFADLNIGSCYLFLFFSWTLS